MSNVSITAIAVMLLAYVFVNMALVHASRRVRNVVWAMVASFIIVNPVKASTIGFPDSKLYKSSESIYSKILEESDRLKNPLNLKDEHRNKKIPKAIAKAAEATGVDPNFLATVANIESTLDPKANNGSAKGLMQITPRTWKVMVRAHAKKHGISKPDIFNPYHAALMGAELMNDNSEWMKSRLKRKARNHEVYMAYFISPLYTVRMIKGNQNRLAINVVPAYFVTGNKSWFYRKGKAVTVKQFIANIKAKIDSKYYEITHPEGVQLANIDTCEKPRFFLAPSSVNVNNTMRSTFTDDGSWWDRHITSVLV